MCVHSLCDIVFHAVTHYEFDANLIRSGIIHQRCKGVAAVMRQMLHTESVHNGVEICTHILTVGVVVSVLIIHKKSSVRIEPILY